ncbi:MAG: hypothetical protein QME78_00290 [Thermodesulfobacteriota bacterium]|nr:hypothetical protein [Thermodesulfobacteriota bacterium]
MTEQEYDDSLLKFSQPLAAIDWETLETGGLPAEGQHLATIMKVGGYMHNFKTYTGSRAKIQLQIKAGPDKGKMVYDDINQPHPQEAQGNVNRRVLIASRLGLISKGSKETVEINWKLLEGKDVLITVVHRKGTGDNANKTYANIDFAGYEDPATAAAAPSPAGSTTPAQYADI